MCGVCLRLLARRKMLYLLVLVVLVGGSCTVLFWLFDFVRRNDVSCSLDKGILSITFISGLVFLFMGGECALVCVGRVLCLSSLPSRWSTLSTPGCSNHVLRLSRHGRARGHVRVLLVDVLVGDVQQP